MTPAGGFSLWLKSTCHDGTVLRAIRVNPFFAALTFCLPAQRADGAAGNLFTYESPATHLPPNGSRSCDSTRASRTGKSVPSLDIPTLVTALKLSSGKWVKRYTALVESYVSTRNIGDDELTCTISCAKRKHLEMQGHVRGGPL